MIAQILRYVGLARDARKIAKVLAKSAPALVVDGRALATDAERAFRDLVKFLADGKYTAKEKNIFNIRVKAVCDRLLKTLEGVPTWGD